MPHRARGALEDRARGLAADRFGGLRRRKMCQHYRIAIIQLRSGRRDQLIMRYRISGTSLDFTPNGREPWLLVARAPGWAEVELHLEEPGGGEVIAPGVKIEEAAIAVIV